MEETATSSSGFDELIKTLSNLTTEQKAIVRGVLGPAETTTVSSTVSGSVVSSETVSAVAGTSTSVFPTSSSAAASTSTTSAGTSQPVVTLSASHIPHVPRLSVFSGDGKDVSYEQWRFEVRSMIHEGLYPTPAILHAVRRSVKGIAANTVLHLGESVSLDAILEKFDHVFGNILSAEMLLEQFYAAKQKSGEDITAWACRLEDLKLQIESSKHL